MRYRVEGPKSGRTFLKTQGANSTTYYYTGDGVNKSFCKTGLEVNPADHNEDTIEEISTELNHNQLRKFTGENYKKLLNPGEGETCSCGCEDSK